MRLRSVMIVVPFSPPRLLKMSVVPNCCAITRFNASSRLLEKNANNSARSFAPPCLFARCCASPSMNNCMNIVKNDSPRSFIFWANSSGDMSACTMFGAS